MLQSNSMIKSDIQLQNDAILQSDSLLQKDSALKSDLILQGDSMLQNSTGTRKNPAMQYIPIIQSESGKQYIPAANSDSAAQTKSKIRNEAKPQNKSEKQNSLIQRESGIKNRQKVKIPASYNLAGQRFGALTVLEPLDERDPDGRVMWKCRCDCGNTVFVSTKYLKDGSTKKCRECQKLSRKKIDITGHRYGILTALYPTEKRDKGKCVIWHCRCDCGNEVDYSCADLQQKKYISCGCLKRAAEAKLKDQVTHVAGTTVELLKNKKIRSDNSTGVTGVCIYRGKYKAKINFQGKTYCLGTYKTLEEAAAVRKEAEASLYGEFLDFYDRWKERSAADPGWGKENPVSVQVHKDETGQIRVSMMPVMT